MRSYKIKSKGENMELQHNEKDGECDCYHCQRERRREREAERVDDLIDEARDKR